MNQELLIYIGQGLLAVVAYFLVKTMDKLNAVSEKALKTETEVALLKQETSLKHEHLAEKIDNLNGSIKNLTEEIKLLNLKQ
jgi:hypothetical protein